MCLLDPKVDVADIFLLRKKPSPSSDSEFLEVPLPTTDKFSLLSSSILSVRPKSVVSEVVDSVFVVKQNTASASKVVVEEQVEEEEDDCVPCRVKFARPCRELRDLVRWGWW